MSEGLAGHVDLDKLERLLAVPGQDLTGFVPALIERLREVEEALRYAHDRLDDCEHTPPHWVTE